MFSSKDMNIKTEFDWQFYLELYKDLKDYNSRADAYEHWLTRGKKEGMIASTSYFFEYHDAHPHDLPDDFDFEDYLSGAKLDEVSLNPNWSDKCNAVSYYLRYEHKPTYDSSNSLTEATTDVPVVVHFNSIKPDVALGSISNDSLEKIAMYPTILRQSSIQKPTFSVVMPIYDRTQLLRESLTSIINQSYENFEVILVLDGSPSETRSVVDEFRERDNRIRVFSYSDSSGNACRGRNRGIIEAKGEYIALSDSDDISAADRLEVSLDTLTQENCVAVAGKARYIIMDGCKNSSVEMLAENEVFPLIYPILKRVNPIVTSTISIRRDSLLKYGGFRREMHYREDHELWLRLSYHNCKMIFIDHVFGLYRLHDSNNELNFKKDDEHWEAMMHKYYKKSFENWYI